MVLPKLDRLKFLSIRVNNEEDAMYALGALLAQHITAIIGKDYTAKDYIEPIIIIYEKDWEEAIEILRHLSFVNRVFELYGIDIRGRGQREYETEYTRALGEKFLPELSMK